MEPSNFDDNAANGGIVPKESDVYDRQIRLWGAEAQAKMAQAKVLYINITGVSSEILKNLVLAGIRASICDTRHFPEAVIDTPCFLITGKDRELEAEDKNSSNENGKRLKYASVAHALKPAIEELNPLLGECQVIDTAVEDLKDQIISQYSIVVASRINPHQARRISKAVVDAGGKFYLTDCFGMNGACAFDLGANHSYRPEKGKELLDPASLVAYVPFDKLLGTSLADAVNRFHKTPPPIWIQYRAILEYVERTSNWPDSLTADEFVQVIQSWVKQSAPSLINDETISKENLRELARGATSEVAPVCSVLGGLIGNEVIKAISGKGEPANNTLLFDGMACKAWTFLVQPSN